MLFTKKIGSTQNSEFNWSTSYEIIQCKGCDNIQFRELYSDEGMMEWDQEDQTAYYYDLKTYYPASIQHHNSLNNLNVIPQKIRIVYNETLEALKSKCYLLTGVGLRAIIEAICLDQQIVGRNLEVKINNLAKNKLITEKDAHRLHSIRFMGNDSVHEMEVPKEPKIRIALNIVEYLINNLYLIDIDAEKHLDTIISNFEDFKKNILKKVSTINVGEEKSIKEILQKDYRRIEQGYIGNFTQELVDQINSGIMTSLEVGQLKPSSIENIPVQHFSKKNITKEF